MTREPNIGMQGGIPGQGNGHSRRACDVSQTRFNGLEQFNSCSPDQMGRRVARASCLVDDGRFLFSDGFESDG